MLKKLAIAAAAACLSTALAPAPTTAQAPAQPQAPGQPPPALSQGAGVRAGYLNCQVARGVGFVFGMTRNLTCTYAHGQATPETYTGDIQQYGMNLGFVNRGVIVWAVIAPSGEIAPGSLAGNYGGVAAGVALGYGLGANALFGGSNNQFGLQPVSFEGMTGLNVAAGIAGLSLRSTQARPAARQQAPR